MSLGTISWRINLPPRSSHFNPSSVHVRKRRRLKILANFETPDIVPAKWDSLLQGFSAAITSANWRNLFLPALGVGSGAAVFLSGNNRLRYENSSGAVAGEWFLIASPTPFNRSVFLRCPSVSLENKKSPPDIASENIFCRGQITASETDAASARDISYQRFCLRTDDGGVISLDWPEHLDLAGELGLDMTVLVVPGTPDGSSANEVRAFVREALGRGVFPVIVNPRGCAGSPLTTPRLFSPADSDDVETAVKFINKSRPWTTLMAIAWGYGANMLTKYIAEAGDETPLTAAVCIDNPFDLNEAARLRSRFSAVEERLICGLIEMLGNNKELFKGKNKGFDVEKALSAKSLREFEAAISMVSFGFESIEEFYSKSSTRELVHRVKIPLLFVQEGETMQHYSVPRSSIVQNALTSLLVISHYPRALEIMRYDMIWCQKLAIEWFSAVELALLKGRNPLLKDIDISIIPPKPSTKETLRKAAYQREGRDFFELGGSKSSSGFSLVGETFDDGQAQLEYPLNDNEEMQECSFKGSEERDENLVDGNRGEILGAASIILNMLDFTMPGTLDDEQKNKILAATESGETFMKAIQEAVPEDVRGKLTNAVYTIIQAQGSKIGTDVLRSIGDVSSRQSEIKLKVPSNDIEISVPGEEVFHDNPSVALASDPKSDIEENGFSKSMPEDAGYGKSSDKEVVSSLGAVNEPDVSKNDQVNKANITNDVEKLSGAEDINSQNTLSSDWSSLGLDVQANNNDYVQTTVSSIQDAIGDNLSDSFSLGHSDQVNGNASVQNNRNHNNSPLSGPSISVSKTLDALTGFDDSTQMAMNNVYGVIENMIDQMDRENEKIDSLEPDDVAKESEGIVLNNLSVPSSPLPQLCSPDQTSDTQGDASNDLSSSIEFQYFWKLGNTREMPIDLKTNPYWGFSHRNFFPKSIPSQTSKVKSPNLECATDLVLDPEEGQWKMLDKKENIKFSENAGVDGDTFGQPLTDQRPNQLFISNKPNYPEMNSNQPERDIFGKQVLIHLIRETVVKALEVEVSRHLGNPEIQDTNSTIRDEIFLVSEAISIAIAHEGEFSIENEERVLTKLGKIPGQLVVRTISHVIRDMSLGRVLPVGVIVGSTIAALRKYFHVTSLHEEYQAKDGGHVTEMNHQNLGNEDRGGIGVSETFKTWNDRAVAVAVTVALGASASLAHLKKNEVHTFESHADISSGPADRLVQSPDKLKEPSEEKQQSNLVSSLAEKAMAVAAPVVPTTDDGKIDQERLVASLAELGQRGGILRIIGKAALLWGGMRGAMSLTDRLISFLQIARRPLLQRILGFICMVLIMWSPVVIPLFPTLVESWRTTTPNSVVEYACIWGLYSAILILIVLWGKRIRDYEDPLQRYGLVFTRSVVTLFLKGLLGGILLVCYVHSINALLGFVSVVWPPVHMPHLMNSSVLVKTYGLALIKTFQGVATAACVAAVEELLFRSWLPEEIAADLGLFHAIWISGFIFSLLQRSLTSVPGFWFLSLALCGAKQRAQGSLLLPIGIRAGTMVANFAVQAGGLLCYQPNTPLWLASPYPWRPFDGASGLAACLLMALYLRPRGLLKSDAKP